MAFCTPYPGVFVVAGLGKAAEVEQVPPFEQAGWITSNHEPVDSTRMHLVVQRTQAFFSPCRYTCTIKKQIERVIALVFVCARFFLFFISFFFLGLTHIPMI